MPTPEDAVATSPRILPDHLDQPSNIEAETQVLGSTLLGLDGIPAILAERLSASHFYLVRHQCIFTAIQKLCGGGAPCDIVSVADCLEECGEIERAGGRMYLNHLVDRVVTTASLDYYIEIVQRDARRRAMIGAGKRIVDLGYDATAEPLVLLDTAREILDAASDDSSSTGECFRVRSIADIRRDGIRSREDVIAGVLPRGGLLQVLGPPKIGKTLFALNLAHAITRGVDFLGWSTLAGRVLYISGEGGIELLDERLQRMVPDDSPELSDFLVWHPTPGSPRLRLDRQTDRKRIEHKCRKEGVTAIFVDPLSALHDAEENDTGAMKSLVMGLFDLGQATGAGVVLNHHTRKPSQHSRSGSPVEGRGSSVLHGAVDASFVLRQRGESLVLYPELRWAESPNPISLKLDPETLRIARTGAVWHGNRKLAPEGLLSLLEEKPQTLDDLGRCTTCSERTIRGNLKALEASGRITFSRDSSNRKAWRVAREGNS